MYSALVSMEMRARHAESFNKSTHHRIVYEMRQQRVPVHEEAR